MIIKIKESFSSDYISRKAGEVLRNKILSALESRTELVLDFEGIVIASTSFFDEGIAKLGSEISPEMFKKFITIKNINKNDQKVLEQVSSFRKFNMTNSHRWRICPIGEHWVKEHPRKTDSGKTSVEGHCRKNPKNKDVIKSAELLKIAEEHFKNLSTMPNPKDLKFPNGNKYDSIIAGWCQYWNETLEPKTPLDPNTVKALIATESGFEPEPAGPPGHMAIGIMQLMPQTIKYLSVNSKELRNHYIEITSIDANDPVINIAAGTRWLFRKYELTKHKLNREPTWQEVLLDYKGILNDNSEIAVRINKKLEKYLKDLK